MKVDEKEKKTLTIEQDSDVILTSDEKRILQNLRNEAVKRPHGRFGPIVFITHGGELQYGIFKETEVIETRI